MSIDVMTIDPTQDAGLAQKADALRTTGAPFAIATVVRTLAATSAKPGAKALIDETGAIIAGFLGGGCVRGAVGRTAREAIRAGAPKLLSLKPSDLLEANNVEAGTEQDGVLYARNGCPSRGSLDIFIEPVLPRPSLVICGAGPVAQAIAAFAARLDYARSMVVPSGTDAELPAVERIVDHWDDDIAWDGAPYVVIATQGQGDEAALRRALASKARYIAFVGSHRKFANLSDKLAAAGHSPEQIARVKAPAGLDICAITPDEIALSILAELTQVRRNEARDA